MFGGLDSISHYLSIIFLEFSSKKSTKDIQGEDF